MTPPEIHDGGMTFGPNMRPVLLLVVDEVKSAHIFTPGPGACADGVLSTVNMFVEQWPTHPLSSAFRQLLAATRTLEAEILAASGKAAIERAMRKDRGRK